MSYVIEREQRYGKHVEWVAAWGLKRRSFPKAGSDEEAIRIFDHETRLSRVPMRLCSLISFGYSVSKTVLAEKNSGARK